MVFSPGQNGKDKKACVQNGKRKGFSKRQKAGDKNRKSPSFNKEKLTLQPSVKRKALRGKKERFTHHQVPRSPQRRQPPITWPIEVIETVSPCIISSTVAEPLSSQSVSLVAQEVMPRELRSAKNNNKKRKNYGKNSPTFILKLYICFFNCIFV